MRWLIFHYKLISYKINVLRQSTCMVVNPITTGNFPLLFNCTSTARTSDFDGCDLKTYYIYKGERVIA